MGLKPHIGKSKMVWFSEPYQTTAGTVTLVTKTMKISEVSGPDEDEVADLCAAIFGGFSRLYKEAGQLPWIVSIASGHAPMAFQASQVDELLQEMPIPAAVFDRYHPLHTTKKRGWLIYYSVPSHLTNARTKFYPLQELSKKDFTQFLTQDCYGMYLDELMLMDHLIAAQDSKLPWKVRMTNLRDNHWVKSRSTDWSEGLILPNQWMSFGIGMALQFLRWKFYFSHINADVRDALAWETMWLGKTRLKI